MMMRNNLSTPRRLPAEWETDSAVLLAWPHPHTDWAPVLDEARDCVKRIADALAGHGVRVVILTPDIEETEAFLALSASRGLLTTVKYRTNDTWARDFGPITCFDPDATGGLRAVDFQFNGWGLKFAADRDNLATLRLAAQKLFKAEPENRRSFILEGGSIETDGNGTLLTTERCLLSPNRNGGWDRATVEAKLKDALGFHTVLWLKHGALEGDDTDSHIDTLARFAPDGTILYNVCLDASDPNYAEIAAMGEEIRSLADRHGFKAVPLPLPSPVIDPDDGSLLPATYANFLALPGLVLVPTYRQPDADRRALQIIAAAFPGCKIEGIDCSILVRQHGSLHCMTMQMPLTALELPV